MQNQEKVQACVGVIKNQLAREFAPKTGIILGTGLTELAEEIDNAVHIPFTTLPDFPQPSVPTHHGRFVAGTLAGREVLVQQGRCHLYEGKSPAEVVMGVRVMARLGIRCLIVTNAAGALNPRFDAGSLMLIEDQINLTGKSPLTGPNIDDWGPRFPDMSRVYDEELMRIARQEALGLGIQLEKGVYLCTQGPQMESRAETRAFRLLGADAVGMSTALEVIAARHLGLRVLGVSCLSNKNLPDCMEEAPLEAIIRGARKAGEKLALLIRACLPRIAG
ncbi:purine-nucleoside phosphorylase, partial [Desulfovibrio sp. OttesenSCG-928-A18]|nr:purine-nucleoside phosphorylase [Desulfovibrio sp. OttesenSCG-928-A18]